ncbi:hypothetical protein L1987_36027 [Smallanthus sonchifolius]|uniref:Uncharacterized protein n=1 Tax=Smallanthus sonchifolius TaxID=185202 RepID=A0ACB9HD95_9ASTR|nr:hypothetical protein L1987_36027 [Smallanthus sonchifolius]
MFPVCIQESSRCWVPGFIINPVRSSTPVASGGDASPEKGDPSLVYSEDATSHPNEKTGGNPGTSTHGLLNSGDNNHDNYEGNIPCEVVNAMGGNSRSGEVAAVSPPIAKHACNVGFGDFLGSDPFGLNEIIFNFGAQPKKKRKAFTRSPSLSSKSSSSSRPPRKNLKAKKMRSSAMGDQSIGFISSGNHASDGGEIGSFDPLGPGSGEQMSKGEQTLLIRDMELTGDAHLGESGLEVEVAGSFP